MSVDLINDGPVTLII
ncbi:MAG TPA: hypothetical protein QGI27_04435 [Flavobacteriaceae bacterium]|nr:hypothetical protein [Flavobacteriaceae bacterium]